MSNFSTVYDFLLHNQKLHARISEFYRALSLTTSSERISMLLNVLVNHEVELMTSLGDYIEKASPKILDTYYQFDREKSVEHLFSSEFTRSQMSSDEVEFIANRFDLYFFQLYSDMLEAIDCEEVQALFKNLRQQMEEGKKRLSIDTNSMKDF